MGNEQLGQVHLKLCFQIQVASKTKQTNIFKKKKIKTNQKLFLLYGFDLVIVIRKMRKLRNIDK